jgi:DNA end-binding protein Ku
MAARALWTGSISFGLVNLPVRVFSAVSEHKLQFHLVHESDDGPIGYEKVCKLDGKPVSNDEIVKAFEYTKGKLVHLTDEDFEAVQVDGQHTIDLQDFVAYDEIDPTFFAHTYLVGPQGGAEKPYALLVRAMTDSGLAGIGKFVLRNRQYLGCLRVRDRTLILEQLHFADEVKAPKEIVPARLPAVSKQELALARSIIEGLESAWRPQKYQDTYTKALRALVKRKVAGHDVHAAAPEPEGAEVVDLMDALRQSVDQVKRSKRATRKTRAAS